MRPKFLKTGDKIALVSPSGKTDKEFIDRGMDVVRSWGLEAIAMPRVYGGFRQFSGSDWERIEDMQKAINDRDFKAIICVRGGYGCSRIVDRLDFSPLLDYPKWLVGFSDITVFHAQFHLMRIESIHGAMVKSYPSGAEEVKNALFGNLSEYVLPSHELNRKGEGFGVVVGGNLTMINNMLGTSSEISTVGKILFIEDVHEQLYHLDRLMVQLRRAKKLENLTGLIVGRFADMKDCETPFGESVEEIVTNAVSGYKYPVCFDFPSGHIEDNRAIYFGRKSRLKVDSTQSSLTFL
ncbi:MAG: LD-carboxypeptidase [Bacteroidales bacterium]|jgi:muramoyltetrapeptide carboxypeptidase|nr:LD-carboxypeptidase [Bacteroidales bacterium]